MKKERGKQKVQNRIILSMMKDRGFSSVKKLSHEVGMSASALGRFVNVRILPFCAANRRWKDSALELSEFFGCLPDDLFKEEHINNVPNQMEAEKSFVEAYRFLSIEHAESLSPERIIFEEERFMRILEIMSVLTPKEVEVISMRFGLGGNEESTLEEIGKSMGGLTRERVRQIEESAIRKLRHPHRIKMLKDLYR